MMRKKPQIVPVSKMIAANLVDVEVEVTALMVPNLYTEMARDKFVEAIVEHTVSYGKDLKELFTMPRRFVVCLHPDNFRVEMCGALKNVALLAAGYCKGLGYGMNVKAAVI